MIAPLAKLMDWSALQFKSMHRPPFIGHALALEKAIELVDGRFNQMQVQSNIMEISF